MLLCWIYGYCFERVSLGLDSLDACSFLVNAVGFGCGGFGTYLLDGVL